MWLEDAGEEVGLVGQGEELEEELQEELQEEGAAVARKGVTDLQGFLAIVMNMGIISVPAIEDYWKRPGLLRSHSFPG